MFGLVKKIFIGLLTGLVNRIKPGKGEGVIFAAANLNLNYF